MNRVRELAIKYTKRAKPTVFDTEIGSKLPEAYKKFYNEWIFATPQAVHYIPYTGNKWIRDETTGEVKRCENIALPTHFPKQLNDIFTGGELVVQGFLKRKKYSYRVPTFWMPIAYKSVIYSEILDKYLSVTMTKRAVYLIHKHQGLDFYLLQTKACDLKSLVALKLKKRLLLALSNKDLPYHKQKNNEILAKYEKYLIPPEEIEWYGLNFTEACKKFEEMEKVKSSLLRIPLKHTYRAEFIQQLQKGLMTKESPTINVTGNFLKEIMTRVQENFKGICTPIIYLQTQK